MRLLENTLYQKDIVLASEAHGINWEKLQGASIALSGATGMIGSFLVDLLMYQNKKRNLNCKLFALGRSVQKAQKRFMEYMDDPLFHFIECDICNVEEISSDVEEIDYFIHAASNTHPVSYANDPIGTITVNVIGLYNLLNLAGLYKTKRFVFVSSNEIYGENRGDEELFREDYCGYIDCNTLRAGYPESKRVSEALCQAYIRQKNMDIVVARLTRSFGPTMQMTDSKALSQFLKKGIAGEDIVLKSDGTQYYSYTYTPDAVTGLLAVLTNGICGEAYNVSSEQCNITLKELAEIIAKYSQRQVVFELPDSVEQAGYSKATKALLDNTKLCQLGWNPKFTIKDGITRTIEILKTVL